jgi:biopolymer transport protein ExbD
MVNLIMFLLVTQATMISLGVVDVTAPTYASAGSSPTKPPDPATDLKLTVGVAKDGFYIAAKGGVLGEEYQDQVTPDGVTRREPTIAKKGEAYDYPALTRKLRSIKTVFPDNTAFFLAADSGIAYDVIVKTLDAAREDAQGVLFPNVAFTRLR